MSRYPEVIRNTGSFQVRKGSLLLYRIGPVNGQRQTHNRKPRDLITGDVDLERQLNPNRCTPTRRGYWAFPAPFQDAFFYFHVYERQMPKKFRGEKYDVDERTKALNAVIARNSPKYIWYSGLFYSHLKPSYATHDRAWYAYNNAREWIVVARKQLFTYYNYNNTGVFKANFSVDHLELFIPG